LNRGYADIAPSGSRTSAFADWRGIRLAPFRCRILTRTVSRSINFPATAMSDPKLTPMLQQYWEVKRSLAPGTLLLFRLGDFYELFFEDAEIGSKLLGITLTRRNEHPMAGIPFHAADNYLGKLLAAGRKVAVCDQL
jgi:hypothetical protein